MRENTSIAHQTLTFRGFSDVLLVVAELAKLRAEVTSLTDDDCLLTNDDFPLNTDDIYENTGGRGWGWIHYAGRVHEGDGHCENTSNPHDNLFRGCLC